MDFDYDFALINIWRSQSSAVAHVRQNQHKIRNNPKSSAVGGGDMKNQLENSGKIYKSETAMNDLEFPGMTKKNQE